jgi:hypothetical protein
MHIIKLREQDFDLGSEDDIFQNELAKISSMHEETQIEMEVSRVNDRESR